MKVLKRILIFIIIALVIQSSALIYLDKYYFATNTTVSTNKVINQAKIKLSENTKQFKISFDGSFLSYFDEDKLKIVNTKLGLCNTVEFDTGTTLSYYRWFPSSNKIIIAEKTPYSKGMEIKFYCYDVTMNDNSVEISKEQINNSIAINDSNIKSEVDYIDISNSPNDFLVKLLKPGQRYDIYKVENMSLITKILQNKNAIGEIRVASNDGNLYYEDTSTKRIKSFSGYNLDIDSEKELTLIGSDKFGNIYVAGKENGYIKNIYWGMSGDKTIKWNVKQLGNPVELKDIYISYEGKIYVNDNLSGIVTELISGIQTPYIGILQNMYDKGIASNDDGNLTLTEFKFAQ